MNYNINFNRKEKNIVINNINYLISNFKFESQYPYEYFC